MDSGFTWQFRHRPHILVPGLSVRAKEKGNFAIIYLADKNRVLLTLTLQKRSESILICLEGEPENKAELQLLDFEYFQGLSQNEKSFYSFQLMTLLLHFGHHILILGPIILKFEPDVWASLCRRLGDENHGIAQITDQMSLFGKNPFKIGLFVKIPRFRAFAPKPESAEPGAIWSPSNATSALQRFLKSKDYEGFVAGFIFEMTLFSVLPAGLLKKSVKNGTSTKTFQENLKQLNHGWLDENSPSKILLEYSLPFQIFLTQGHFFKLQSNSIETFFLERQRNIFKVNIISQKTFGLHLYELDFLDFTVRQELKIILLFNPREFFWKLNHRKTYEIN
jgi:hypothetical protein